MPAPQFDGLAQQYDKFRPSYPTEAYQDLLRRAADHYPVDVLDAGCGTGINARILRDLLGADCASMTGVDISVDMLETARQALPEGQFLMARAEQLPLPDASIDIVIAAQAVQWFDRTAFYKEAQRVLRPRGLIALLENNRDWKSSPFLDHYETMLENFSIKDDGSHYSRFYRDFSYEQELQERFNDVQLTQHRWQRTMTQDEFLGMAVSSTQVQRMVRRFGQDFLIEELTRLFATDGRQGRVAVPYVTLLYCGQRA